MINFVNLVTTVAKASASYHTMGGGAGSRFRFWK